MKTFKYRLYPNSNQERELHSQLETLRRVYNESLAWWRDAYKKEKEGEVVIPRVPKKNGNGERKKGLQETLYPIISAKRNATIESQKSGADGPHWLARVSSTAVRDTIARVEVAYKNFFERIKKGVSKDKLGYPRFKPYGCLTSIPFDNYYGSGCSLRNKEGKHVDGNTGNDLLGYRLDVFGVGKIKVKLHRPLEGKIKTVSVKRDSLGVWYVCFACEIPPTEVPARNGKPPVGVDVGLQYFLTTSYGEHIENPRYLKMSLKRLRVLQRSASRKREVAKKSKRKFRECKNLAKANRKVAKLHMKVRNKRKENHYLTAHSLVNRYGTICVESLNVQGMVKNNKLSRSISDAGWSSFTTILDHVAKKAGSSVVKVDAKGTSQTCPRCDGHVPKKLSERVHNCHHCGYKVQRDHASAQVILKRGVGCNGLGNSPADAKLEVTPICRRIQQFNPYCDDVREVGVTDSEKRKVTRNRSKKATQQPCMPGLE
jgi:putative transposase